MKNEFKVDAKVIINPESEYYGKCYQLPEGIVGTITSIKHSWININWVLNNGTKEHNNYKTKDLLLHVKPIDPYADLKAAQKEGAVIQLQVLGSWLDWDYPDWTRSVEDYRIKSLKNLDYYDNLYRQYVTLEVLHTNGCWVNLNVLPSCFGKTADKFRVKTLSEPTETKYTYAEWGEIHKQLKELHLIKQTRLDVIKQLETDIEEEQLAIKKHKLANLKLDDEIKELINR